MATSYSKNVSISNKRIKNIEERWKELDEVDRIIQDMERSRRDRFEKFHERLIQDLSDLRSIRNSFDSKMESAQLKATYAIQRAKVFETLIRRDLNINFIN